MRDEETGTGFAEAKLSEILRFGRVAPSLRMTHGVSLRQDDKLLASLG